MKSLLFPKLCQPNLPRPTPHTHPHTLHVSLMHKTRSPLPFPNCFTMLQVMQNWLKGLGMRETNSAHMKQTGANLSVMQSPVSPSWLVATACTCTHRVNITVHTSAVSCQIPLSDIWTSSPLTAWRREIHHTNVDTLSLESCFQTHPCKGGRTTPRGQN